MQFIKMIGCREMGSLESTSKMNKFTSAASTLALKSITCSPADVFPTELINFDDVYPAYVPTLASKFSTVAGQEHILALVNEDGELHILDTNKKGSDSVVQKIDAHRNAVFDCCWLNNAPRHLVTASGDTTAALWDVVLKKRLAEFRGHTSSIKTIDVRPDDQAVFATGSRDSNILVWDVRTNRKCNQHHQPVNVIRGAHCLSSTTGNTTKHRRQKKNVAAYDPLQSVTAVVFRDDHTLISSGTADGSIKVWDLRKTYCSYRNEPVPTAVLSYAGKSVKKHGYSSIVMDSSRCRLFANCTDNAIYEFNCVSFDPEPVNRYLGHQNSTFFIKLALCPSDNFMISGSSDSYAYIWKIGTSGPPAYRLSGHYSEVTTVDFCRQKGTIKLVTCADDMKTKIWRVSPGMVSDQTNGRIEELMHSPDVNGNKTANSGMTPNASGRIYSVVGSATVSATPVKRVIPAPSPLAQSPTLNLPNSVMDRTPLSSTSDERCSPYQRNVRRRKCDWLTSMATTSSENKRLRESSRSASTTPTGTGKTATPRRRLKVSSSRNSLEKYFRSTRL